MPHVLLQTLLQTLLLALLTIALSAPLHAQSPTGPPPPGFAGSANGPRGAPPARSGPTPHDPASMQDRWWGDRRLLPALGLPGDQQARLEATYQQARVELDGLDRRAVETESALASLAHAPEAEATALAQAIEEWTTARRDLEVARLRLLLTLRSQLSVEQWHRLRELQRSAAPRFGAEPGAAAGPGSRPGPSQGSPQPPGLQAGPMPPPQPMRGPHPPGPVGPPLRLPPQPRGPDDGRPNAAPRGIGLPAGPPLPPGLWWHDEDGPRLPIALTREERDRLDAIFVRHRDGLEDARTALEREERELGPRLAAEPLELAVAVAQVARVADARRALERELLALRCELWLALGADQRTQFLQVPPGGAPPSD